MTTSPPLVLVTGAGGFVGHFVCRELAARGYAVRAMVRTRPAPPEAKEVVRVESLLDEDTVNTAARGADAVVHLAARVHKLRESAQDRAAAYRRENVDATRGLAAAAGDARCFLFMSSVKAVGEANDHPWSEDVQPRPVDPYGVSKLEAEGVCAAWAAQPGRTAVILRPPIVYGAGAVGNMARLFRLVDSGVPIPLGGIDNRRSMVYVETLADAVGHTLAWAFDSSVEGAHTYFIADRESYSTPQLIRAIGTALGRPANLVPFPATILRALARLGDLVPSELPMPLTSPAVDRLTGSLALDTSKVTRETGFVPRFTLEEGLARMATWFRSQREVSVRRESV